MKNPTLPIHWKSISCLDTNFIRVYPDNDLSVLITLPPSQNGGYFMDDNFNDVFSTSPALRVFTQPFIQAQIKENIKVPRHWPLCGQFTGDRWIPRTNGQYSGAFHFMTLPFDDVIMENLGNLLQESIRTNNYKYNKWKTYVYFEGIQFVESLCGDILVWPPLRRYNWHRYRGLYLLCGNMSLTKKSRDVGLSDRYEIRREPQQLYFWGPCQISERVIYFNTHSRGYET